MSEPGNNLAKAKNIGVLSGVLKFKDSLRSGNRRDFYRFSLSSSSSVNVVLKGLRVNADLALIGGSGNQIAISKQQGKRNERIQADLASGVYYVKVYNRKGKTSYRLKLQGTSGTEGSQLSAEAEQILAAHNRYRQEAGVPLLSWSNELEGDAKKWANHLAALGGNTLEHDSSRNNQGENLWLGTAGAFSVTDAVDTWGAEKQFFRDGIFPDVSSTGHWEDVGHYTQMIWRNTLRLGCSRVTAGGNDILVCRYSPSGNYIGQPVL